MRKTIEGLSFIRGALLLSVLLLGFFFRTLGLENISAWGDEVASWYYSQHLGMIMPNESHTPGYYFLCWIWYAIFPKTILSLRYFSISLTLGLALLGSFFYFKRQGFKKASYLFTLWWLWPTSLIFDRQARHYGLYFDLTLLVLILWPERRSLNKYVWWILLAFYQFIHPLAVIPILFLCGIDQLNKRDHFKLCLFDLSSSLPVMIYYLVRFSLYGQERVMSNIAWISTRPLTFIRDILMLFAGDSFPLNQFYFIPWPVFFFLMAGILILFLVRNTRAKLTNAALIHAVVVVLLTVGIVELSALGGTNLRISRYYIYAVAFFLFALVDSQTEESERQFDVKFFILFFFLTSYSTFLQKPWNFYQWDDQIVQEFKRDHPEYKTDKNLVICGNRFQLLYYFDRDYAGCSEEAFKRYYEAVDFSFFDLNGNDKLTLAYLMQNGKVSQVKEYDHAYYFHFQRGIK